MSLPVLYICYHISVFIYKEIISNFYFVDCFGFTVTLYAGSHLNDLCMT